jgi:hypothetical protein
MNNVALAWGKKILCTRVKRSDHAESSSVPSARFYIQMLSRVVSWKLNVGVLAFTLHSLIDMGVVTFYVL